MSERLKHFKDKGYVIFRGLLSKPEVERFKGAMEDNQAIQNNVYGRSDGKGMRTRVCLWNILPNNIAGTVARSEEVVGAIEELLEGEIYHYHSKLIMKDASAGGAFLWHQDYGYWYEFKCLYPTMGTLWIAVDRADRNNGCVQILEGSHHVGRVEHTRKGDQMSAVVERVEALKQRLPLRYVELDPGDAVFFHSNILHSSDQNVSGERRWAFLVCYNKATNIPYAEHQHADYEPIKTVPHSDIMTSSTILSGENMKFWTTNESNSVFQKKHEK